MDLPQYMEEQNSFEKIQILKNLFHFIYIFIILTFKMIQQPYSTIFMFINRGSGGGIGQKLVSQEIEKLEFQIQIQQKQPPKIIYVYFFDLKTKRDKAFKLVKQATQLDQKVIGIVCGGDGTIMWVVSQLFKYQINAMKIALGVIPLGTGNDFSQYLGWGKEKTSIIQNNYKHLKKLIKKWIVAKQQQFDIWDLRAEIYENGRFQKVNKDGQNETIRSKQGPRTTTINYSFCNYFSFGIDAKIGYSFDKHRTQSRLGNLMVYGTMGLIKAATKTKTLQELIQKMEIRQLNYQELPNNKPLDEDSIINEREQSKQYSLKLRERNRQTSIIFKTKSSIKNLQVQSNNKTILLENDYQNFLVLNINSFMGGVSDIWNKAKINQNTIGAFYSQTSSKDGKLQIMCFASGMGLALQRLIGGFATKITQGQGPYHLNFNRYENEPKHRTYLQIDGQFIRFTHPKTIYISKSKLGSQGKIRVLRRNLQGQRSLNI